jgi:glycosyltransferase involved in cell wall biosynthesis
VYVSGSVAGERHISPLVSIVTPSLNQAEFIGETIASVLAQDYPYLEYLVIDGGSTDGTLDVLRSQGPEVLWVSEPDKGQTHAINKGFRQARGEILAWLDADNLYMPSAVSTAVRFLDAHPEVMMVHGNCRIIDSAGRVIAVRRTGNVELGQLLGVNTVAPGTAFFRREVLETVGRMDESLHFVFDWEYWVRISSHGLRMAHLPVILASFREHRQSKTMTRKELFWRERHLVLDRIFSSDETSDAVKSLRRRSYAGVSLSKAYFYLQHGALRTSALALFEAVRTWPGILFAYSPLFVARALWDLCSARLGRAPASAGRLASVGVLREPQVED